MGALVVSDLRAASQEAIDEPALAGADVRVAIGCNLLQHHARRDRHPLSVEQGVPEPILVEGGAGRPAIALDTGRRAVATGEAGVRLCEVLVPVVVFGMTIAVVAALGSRKIADAPRRETSARADL